MIFMNHLPHATHRQLCVPSLPNLALTLIYTWAVTSASAGHLRGGRVAARRAQAAAVPSA
jgi:hypothetical protein